MKKNRFFCLSKIKVLFLVEVQYVVGKKILDNLKSHLENIIRVQNCVFT